ncbi:hypothetical protein SePPVgORF064 [Seal parapoxvirus]|uniref:Uncharacterized protein n=1 Tax=Seal parapoxvirus TaxID=187984 RepID=A0A1Z3GCT0_9POXV|nr:hypothetical protein CGV03_gp064 [Seal parapoxvirus]ASC55567.1 hypothetical protein SePPVgORF064 [Seal parapoxvirus]
MARRKKKRTCSIFHENLHMPSARAALGPHVHFPQRRLVLRCRGVRAYVGDAISSSRELQDPICAQAIVFGNGFVETYSRNLDPRLLGAYHALARPVCERPLFAVPGWRRRFPVVFACLNAMERKTRRVLRSMCRTYANFSRQTRKNAVARPAILRRWFGYRTAKTRCERLCRQRRNRGSKLRAEKRKRFCNYYPL